MRESIRKLWGQLISIKGPPRSIALGFALGLFIGMTPTMGIQTGIAVFFAFVFRWNLVSASMGVWITNPFTAPFIYSITYMVGKWVMSLANNPIKPLPAEENLSLLKLIMKTPNVLWAMLIGGIILGIPIAIAGYYFVYEAIVQYRLRIKERLTVAVDKVIQKSREKRKTTAKEKRKKGKRRKKR